jgi:hypothetical protein
MCHLAHSKYYIDFPILFVIKILLCWGYIVTFPKFLTICDSTLPLFSYILPSPLPGIVLTGLIFFFFTYECMKFPLYSPSYIIFLYHPSYHYCLPRQNLFYLPVLFFLETCIFICLR